MNVGDTIKIASKEQLETVKGEVLTSANSGLSTQFAQHGLVPNDGVNEIRPDDMFKEVDAPDILVDKKGYPVRFTDGIYDRLGEELVVNGDFGDGTTGWVASNSIANVSNNILQVIDNGVFSSVYQKFTFSIGTVLLITGVCVKTVERASVYFGSVEPDGTNYGEHNTYETFSSGLFSFIYIVTTPEQFLCLNSNYTGSSSWSNISVKELPQFQLPAAPFSRSYSLTKTLTDPTTVSTDANAGDHIKLRFGELINGTDDINNWTAVNAEVSIDGDILTVDDSADSGGSSSARMNIELIASIEYEIEFEVTENNNYSWVTIWGSENSTSTDNGDVLSYVVLESNTTGKRKTVFTSNYTGTATLGFGVDGDGIAKFKISSMSLKLKDENGIFKAKQDATNKSLYDTNYFAHTNQLTKDDELLDDGINGLATQYDHKASDIVVTGKELVTVEVSFLNGTYGEISIENKTIYISQDENINYAYAHCILQTGVEYTITIEKWGGDKPKVKYTASEGYVTPRKSYTFVADGGSLYFSNLTAENNTSSYFENISVKLKDQSYIATKDAEAGQVLDAGEWDTRQSYATDVLVKNNNKVYKCIQSYTANDMWDTDKDDYVTDNVVEYNGKVYKALQNADANINITDTAYWEYQRDTVEINSTDYWEYQYDLGFKSIPYVTKQAALLIEKTNDGVINNIALPLVNMYGEEHIETYEQDIFNELGFSQKADRVYTDGSSEYILLGLKTYLNSLAYHIWYNPLGSRKFSDDKLWYETTDVVGGLYDCL